MTHWQCWASYSVSVIKWLITPLKSHQIQFYLEIKLLWRWPYFKVSSSYITSDFFLPQAFQKQNNLFSQLVNNFIKTLPVRVDSCRLARGHPLKLDSWRVELSPWVSPCCAALSSLFIHLMCSFFEVDWRFFPPHNCSFLWQKEVQSNVGISSYRTHTFALHVECFCIKVTDA